MDWIAKAATALMISAALLGVDAESGAQIPCSYEIAAIIEGPDCGILGQASAVGTGISPNGEYVCGYFTCPGGNDVAFLYTVKTGEVTTIPFSQGFYSMIANDVNDSAIVVGTGQKTTAGLRGFVHDANKGMTTELLPQNLPDGWSAANAINNRGVVCGWRSIDDGGDPTHPRTAFVWTSENGFVDLGLFNGYPTIGLDINNNNSISGSFYTGTAMEPFVWSDNGIMRLDIFGAVETYPLEISDFDHVVGWFGLPTSKWPFQSSHAFLWHQDKVLDLGTLPGDNRSVAFDVNSAGTVVGLSRYLAQQSPVIDHAFVWHLGEMQNVMDLLAGDWSGSLYEASAIDEAGMLVAPSRSPDGDTITLLLAPQLGEILADVDNNCRVDVDDLLIVINEWGKTKSPADINHDEIVNYSDLLLVIENWTLN